MKFAVACLGAFALVFVGARVVAWSPGLAVLAVLVVGWLGYERGNRYR